MCLLVAKIKRCEIFVETAYVIHISDPIKIQTICQANPFIWPCRIVAQFLLSCLISWMHAHQLAIISGTQWCCNNAGQVVYATVIALKLRRMHGRKTGFRRVLWAAGFIFFKGHMPYISNLPGTGFSVFLHIYERVRAINRQQAPAPSMKVQVLWVRFTSLLFYCVGILILFTLSVYNFIDINEICFF